MQLSDSQGGKTSSYSAVVDSHGNWLVYGINASSLADGAITYTVTATDAVGNSTVQTANAAKGTQAPALTITSYTNPINLASKDVVAASDKTRAGDSVSVQVSDGATTVSTGTKADTNGTWSIANLDVHTLQDGPITYTVTATDASGNSTVKTVDTVKDTATPPVSIASVTTAINAANQTSTSANGTSGAGDTVSLYVVDAQGTKTKTYTTTADNTGSWSIGGIVVSGLADGTLTYTATATDAYGNVSSTAATKTASKDTVPAELTISSVSNVNSTSGGIATVSGTSDANDTITVQVSDGTNTVSNTLLPANNTGSWQINVNVGSLADGTLTYTVTAAKADGNSTTKTATAIKETVAPALSITNDTNPINAANETGVVVSGTTAPNATVTVQASDGTNTTTTYTATVDSHGNWSVYGINVSALNDGTITYTATATDAAGNTTTTNATATKDTEAPVLTVSSYTGNYYIDDVGNVTGVYINSSNVTAVAINGTTDPGAAVAVHLIDANGNKTLTYYATGNSTTGTWSISGIDASSLADGTVFYDVSATSTSTK